MPFDLSSYTGVPWRDDGRERGGVDCYGLLHLVYREQAGIELPRHDGALSTNADAKALTDLIDRQLGPWIEIERGFERQLDAVLMLRDGFPCHVGIVERPGWVLHVESGCNAVVEPYSSMRMARRIVGFYRHERAA